MPRTKVVKTSKRSRDAQIREEKVRQFENGRNDYLNRIDAKAQSFIEDWENEMKCLKQRIKVDLLQMKMEDFFKLNLSTFTTNVSQHCSSVDSMLSQSVKGPKSQDEGYLTEDSSGGNVASKNVIKDIIQLTQDSSKKRLRTPGPLSSAMSRNLRRGPPAMSRSTRRSRSACTDYLSTTRTTRTATATKNKSKHAATESDTSDCSERQGRNMYRTPQTKGTVTRSKAHSVGRTQYMPETFDSPPAAFMRWPKPGELIMSTAGTPIVAQALPDTCANVTIPVKDGVLSLRPKKLQDLHADILDNIEPETLNQLKTLHSNLNRIVNLAEQKITTVAVSATGTVKKSVNKKNKPK